MSEAVLRVTGQAVACIVLVALGIPALLAAVLLLPGDPASESLRAKRPVSAEALRTAIASREDALVWRTDGRVLVDVGTLRVALAINVGERTDEGRQQLRRAEEDLIVGLASMPANTFAWAQLAVVRASLYGIGSEPVGAVLMSLESGRFSFEMTRARLGLALDLWNRLGPHGQAKVDDQLQLMWRYDPGLVADIARTGFRRIIVAGRLAAYDPEAAQLFLRMTAPVAN